MRLARFLSLRIGLGLCGALALLPLVLACRNQTTDEKLAAGEPTQAGVASMTDDSGSTTRRASDAERTVEKDLVLQGTLKTPAVIDAGEDVRVSLILCNTSRDKSHAVVAPGDGSEVGWREPHVYFTATIGQRDGIFQPVPEGDYGRCGFFDSNWQKDARVLKPGDSLPLDNGLSQPSEMLDFQSPGHVRLFAHYRYGGGVTAKGGKTAKPVASSGLMAGVPAFELTSEPMEFDVLRPLDLVLTVKGSIVVKTTRKASDLIEIRLVNRSGHALEVSNPNVSPLLSLRLDGKMSGWGPMLTSRKPTFSPVTLKPGQEESVMGQGVLANGMDGDWEYPVPDTIKLRARYYVSIGTRVSVLYSNWAEIKAIGR